MNESTLKIRRSNEQNEKDFAFRNSRSDCLQFAWKQRLFRTQAHTRPYALAHTHLYAHSYTRAGMESKTAGTGAAAKIIEDLSHRRQLRYRKLRREKFW